MNNGLSAMLHRAAEVVSVGVVFGRAWHPSERCMLPDETKMIAYKGKCPCANSDSFVKVEAARYVAVLHPLTLLDSHPTRQPSTLKTAQRTAEMTSTTFETPHEPTHLIFSKLLSTHQHQLNHGRFHIPHAS